MRSALARVRDEFGFDDVVAGLVVVLVFAALGAESDLIVVFLAYLIVAPVARAVLEGVDLDPLVAGLAFGGAAALAGAVQFRAGNVRFGAVLAAAGAWLCLDAVDRRRRGPDERDAPADDLTREEFTLASGHNRWLLEELRAADRPLTKRELGDRTGLADEDLERLFDVHGEDGPIRRVGTGYVLDESALGPGAMVGSVVRSVGGRLLRPFRLFRPSG